MQNSNFTRYVNVLLFDTEGEEVALIKKTRPSFLVGTLNGIGGKILEGESVDSAVIRKLKQEAGISEASLSRFAILRSSLWEVHFFADFLSNSIYEAKTQTDEEVGRYYTTNLENLPLAPALSFFIPMALDFRFNQNSYRFFDVSV